MYKSYTLLALLAATMMSTTEAIQLQAEAEDDTAALGRIEGKVNSIYDFLGVDDDDSGDYSFDDTVVISSDDGSSDDDAGGNAVVDSDVRCFIDPIYDDRDVRVLEDISYGSAKNAATDQQQDLLLDAFLPPTSDTRDKIPAIVFMHGGGFTGGSKRTGRKFALEMVKLGYAVFSINYRLTGDYWDQIEQKYVHDA